MQHELFMLTMRRSYWIMRSCIVVVRVFSCLEVRWGEGLYFYIFICLLGAAAAAAPGFQTT
jgi:hypothetical protein